MTRFSSFFPAPNKFYHSILAIFCSQEGTHITLLPHKEQTLHKNTSLQIMEA